MARPILDLKINDEQRKELERRVKSPTTSQRDSLRAGIILLRSQGIGQAEVAERLETSQVTVSKWTRAFLQNGLDGLADKPGRGRKSELDPLKIERVLTATYNPPPGRSRWSVRTMAQEVGISPTSVHKIWKANDLKPHRTKTFKISKDSAFVSKFWDVIGLYLNPPEKALVLCCDEKTQCQALERSQPGLPLGIGHICTKTHDYIRHGTITLFCALNYLDGKLITRTEQKHSHVEWLRFLKQIHRETPKDLDLHLIVDNYSTHKHEKVKKWVERHPRVHLHFTPTGSSWMNMVERFFADLTQDVVREGSFCSVGQLVQSMEVYLAERNCNPRPYQWRAEGKEILQKIQRARKAAGMEEMDLELNKPISKTGH